LFFQSIPDHQVKEGEPGLQCISSGVMKGGKASLRLPFRSSLTGPLAKVHATIAAPKPEQTAQLSQKRALSLAYRAGWRLQLQLLPDQLRHA